MSWRVEFAPAVEQDVAEAADWARSLSRKSSASEMRWRKTRCSTAANILSKTSDGVIPTAFPIA